MDSINKTLYIPLYGKASVSKKGIILNDKTAERVWAQNVFPLGRKSKSKWLTYFMAMRTRVFDDWVSEKLSEYPDAAVFHIGCGLDSRVERVKGYKYLWYDVDFPDVISERRKHFWERDGYHMIPGNAAKPEWLTELPLRSTAIVLMEGISMYLSPDEIQCLFAALGEHFNNVHLLMDVYTKFGAKMTRFKNPINDVGVSRTYGIDDPTLPTEKCKIQYLSEQLMTPPKLVNELHGFERCFFSCMFAGAFARKMYRLYEYK